MKKWLYITLLMLLFSCNKGGNVLTTRPAGVLSKSQMIDLLVDINIAESSLRVGTPSHNQNSDTVYQRSQYIKLFEEHHLTPENFDKSLTYYSEHIDDLNDITTEVINKITAMQAKLEGKNANKVPKLQRDE